MPQIPNKDQIAHMMAHIDDTLVPDIIACVSICGVISIIVIILRIMSRRVANAPLQMSDWLIMVAWLIFATFEICFALVVKYGGGRHIILITELSDARMLQILNIINENLYCVSMAFIKFSILSMYGSIFPQRRFRYCLIAVGVFMGMWVISFGLVAIFQCTPFAFGWDPSILGGSCVNYGAVVLAAGVCNIITDFVILTMPIPLVLKLNLSKQKKRMIIFTFMMGGSACIISLIRLGFSLKVGTTADGSWDDMPAGMLSTVELMAGILAASIPVYRPLYRRILNKKPPGTTRRSLEPPSFVLGSRSVKITSGGIANDPSKGIVVTDDININMSALNRNVNSWVPLYDEGELRLFHTSAKESTSTTTSTSV